MHPESNWASMQAMGHRPDAVHFEFLKYDLQEPGLLRLAKIVLAADVAEATDTDPTWAWVSSGRSKSHSQPINRSSDFFKSWKASSKSPSWAALTMQPCM